VRAGELTPIEKAERRVLVMCNPGLGLENMQATPTIYIGLQLIQPGESAPNHRTHAVRDPLCRRGVGDHAGRGREIADGAWRSDPHAVGPPARAWSRGQRAGDLARRAGFAAHSRDRRVLHRIEGRRQAVAKPIDSGPARFRNAGVLPYALLDGARAPYPLLRFRWREVREALGELARVTAAGELAHLAYVHPQTGRECLPTLGFSALMLRPGETARLARRSASAVLQVIDGAMTVSVAGAEAARSNRTDTCAVPNHEAVLFDNSHSREAAYVFVVDDAPLHRKLGIYETWPNNDAGRHLNQHARLCFRSTVVRQGAAASEPTRCGVG
jgi:gentisate 1,2-dioxygenase